MSITAVTATGVPKPARASSSAPKQNAMMMAWMRWSGDKEPKARRSTRSYPVSSVIRKIQIAVKHDPDDREQPERRALAGRQQGLSGRHPEREDGHGQRHQQGGHARLPCLPTQGAEQHEQGQQRQRRDKRGERQRPPNRIGNLLKHRRSFMTDTRRGVTKFTDCQTTYRSVRHLVGLADN